MSVVLVWTLPAAAHPLLLYVDGRKVETVPMARDVGEPFAPARALMDALGGTIGWDEAERRIDMRWNGRTASFWLDSYRARLDRRMENLTGAPFLDQGRAQIPVAPLAKAFGLSIQWSYSHGFLTVSRPGVPAEVEHVVGPGESLALLGQWLLSSPSAIIARNSLASADVTAGDRLVVPIDWAAAPKIDPLRTMRFTFPFPLEASYPAYWNDYGAPRTWAPDGTRDAVHEGIDLMAPKGEPLVAIGSGIVSRIGWTVYGGNNLTIQLDHAPYNAYYAHLSAYAPGLKRGDRVQKGQLVGYVGSTGNGVLGTDNMFAPHLHFGLYEGQRRAVNPYEYLRYWEQQRVSLAPGA